MEENPTYTILDGKITGIRFGLATRQEICISSNSDCPIGHASQLSNPFLGLPLESGKCESCGTAEPGKCEGHFGYIELPIPIYHPSHVNELKRMLSLLCLKCLKLKNRKFQVKNIGVLERALSSCCEEASQISINEVKTTDGASYLELKIPSRSRLQEGFWNFLERYGFRYGDNSCRALLPSEVMVILKKIPEATRKKLSGKGYFPQDGYILQYLPVPPNCLSVPDISDGISVMSSDLSITMLKKVLKQVEIIKSSRSGTPNFESHEVEACDLQAAVAQYLQVRGTAKASRDIDTRFGISKEPNNSSTKAWLEKMKTLFIRKGSGFSSRSVITGDPYKGVAEIGLPFEIAQRITFEERVNEYNMRYLQKLVDEKMCLTYTDGSSTYSLREGSKGHTFLRPGQVVHRRIMDGDIVFINRPPTTHKHSLQALSVYVHDDHTVKVNPLICGPLSADFDGDCVHLFYPQSLAAKAEVLELFSVEKQLLSSHSGNLNLQLATDSLLSLKIMFKNYFLSRAAAQQLALFVSNSLPRPALLRAHKSGPLWTALQLLQTALPSCFECCGERHLIYKSQILKVDFNRDVMQSIISDIVTSIFFGKGPNEVLSFFNSLQPMLMENLFSEGFSVGLEDFFISRAVIENIQMNIQDISPLLYHLRSTYNELVELQLENHMRLVKMPVTNFILKSSAMGSLIDSKSDSAITKVVQQVGFLGLQLSDKGKFYSRTLLGDMASLFHSKYPFSANYPCEEFGLVRSCLFHGLDPYQEMVHSISSREVIVRSSRGLTEPGTLFKNLMAILRDVVICYDGTVRNVCSNSIIQFEYGVETGIEPQSFFAAGEPVGVLAATAMSNPAYKAVLDSSPSSNSSWEMMKEILLCGVNFKNDLFDRRVILYLNDCGCGRKYCRENAAYLVKNQLKKVSLKDAAVEFLIEYRIQQAAYESSEIEAGLVGHIHLNKIHLKDSNISMPEILEKCQETMSLFRKKKKIGQLFKGIVLSFSECCSFRQSGESKFFDMPCLKFFWQDTSDHNLEWISHIFADTICPVLLETIIKGDPRVSAANIIWISPDTATWIRNPCKSQKGELALDVVLEKEAVKRSGDAWRIVVDSCLPVIHLIDTRRSIPYAIKQVQELLGISCAFEQAVQRLSTSVTMVTKGVLKEHLILLANSMTCAGNLIGFNIGGIKALSRSLNVQVPFTEATLFTPKKCFERAAEKCHVDALSSIVASCSWGKHVAIGTGSPFDVLWDTREVGLHRQAGIDVYNFLHLVRGSSGEETNSGCLGAEIDIFDMEDEYMESGRSPEQNCSFDKPIFEDSAEFDYDLQNQKLDGSKTRESNWEKVPSLHVESSGGWERVAEKKQNMGADATVSKPNGWSHADSSAPTGWGAKESGKDIDHSGSGVSWGKKVEKAEETRWNKKDSQPDRAGGFVSSTAGAWSERAEEDSSWGAKECRKGFEQSGSVASWDKKVEEAVETDWNKKDSQPLADQAGCLVFSSARVSGEKVKEDSSRSPGWGAFESGKGINQSGSRASWGKNVEEADETRWNKKGSQPDRAGGLVSSTTGAWSEKAEDSSRSTGWGAAESGNNLDQSVPQTAWGKKVEVDRTGWNKKDAQLLPDRAGDLVSSSAGAWSGKTKEDSSRSTGWGAAESGKNLSQSGSRAAWGKKVEEADETRWNKKDSQLDRAGGLVSSTAGAWSEKVEENSSRSTGWGAAESGKNLDQSGSHAAWGKKVEEVDRTSWNKKDAQLLPGRAGDLVSSSAVAWSGKTTEDSSRSTGWGAAESGKNLNQSGSQAAWGKKVEEVDGIDRNKKDSQLFPDRSDDLVSSSAGAWSEKEKEDSSRSTGWGALQSGKGLDQSVSWSSWGKKVEEADETGWNKKEGWGSSTAGEWKNKRNPPSKSVGGSNEDIRANGIFTATRQRLDMFTSEEQDVLLDVEPIMLSIRRIMHQSGYNDGDPLSADDQSYIIENVFNYHPDKVVKMGTGIDYVMVNKHVNFQESRCFYIVSTDGHKEDFSYRKCLENFVKGKYPDKVESFMAKYFRKPQPRPGWNRENRERSVAPEEAGTENRPGWNKENRERSVAPEEGGAENHPGWNRENRERNVAPEETGTENRPSWNRENRERTGAPEEAGTDDRPWAP